VDGGGVSGGSDNEGGAGVEDGGAAVESEVFAINGRGETTLPETFLVDVLEGDEGLCVELGLVEASERDLAIFETTGKSGDLVRRDSLADQLLLCKRLDGGWDTLVGKGGLGQAHQTIELGSIAGEIHRLHKSNAKDMFIQSQTSDVDVISDDIPRHLTRTICNLEGLSGVLEGGRRFRAQKDVITLCGEATSEQIGIGPRETIRTQPPPAWDLHPSPPIQKSEEPLSIKMEKSRGGFPALMVATYPTSFALSKGIS